mgnify:CR=1 FL=1
MDEKQQFNIFRQNPTIVANPFVQRQTAASEFSYHVEGIDAVVALAQEGVLDACTSPSGAYRLQCGYRDGVRLLRLPSAGFMTAVLQLKEGDRLTGSYKARRPGEKPRKSIQAYGEKMPARQVDVVLYSSIVLAEDGDNFLPPEVGNWEIVSVNASPVEGDIPIHPDTLIANHYLLDGGTATGMTPEQFEETLKAAVLFWQDKAMAAPQGAS